jgi:hypothetical protein
MKCLSERDPDGECDDQRQTQEDLLPGGLPFGTAPVGELARAACTFRGHGA